MHQPSRALNLQSVLAKITSQEHTLLKVPSTIYNIISMTKEFDNEINEQYTIYFMEKEL